MTVARTPVSWTLAGIVRDRVGSQSDQPMITYGDRVITWSEMHARSSQLAQALLAEGIAVQDRVAIVDKNGPEYFEVLFGGGKVNAVNVAVNWRLAPAEMAYIVNDAKARVLFVGPDFLDHLAGFEHQLQTVRKIVVLGDQGGDHGHEGYEDWLARHRSDDPGVEPAEGDVAMQLYTSGTTGVPKGVLLTNLNLGTLGPLVSAQWRLDPASVNLVCMPLFHIGGSGWAVVGMWNGCHTLLFREFVPSEILAAIPAYEVTNVLFVPAMLGFLTLVPESSAYDYSTLRSIVYGASPITDEVLTRSMITFGCDFIQVYGLTETTGAITQLDSVDHDLTGRKANLLRSAGRPYPHVELRIVDGAGTDLKPLEVGELWTRSVQNMKGYWNQPEQTAAALTADGWLKTGDAGYLDEDGYLFLTDRVKDMIVTGGENVYPAEIENALSHHPGIADSAVIGIPDPMWGEAVKAVVVCKDGAVVSAAEVIAHARGLLAGYKCPTSVDFVDVLPRNPSGKVLKRELREPYWMGHDRAVN